MEIIVSFWGALLFINGVFMFFAIIPGLFLHNDIGWKALVIAGCLSIFIGGLMRLYTKDQ